MGRRRLPNGGHRRPYTTRLECETNLPDAVRDAVEQYAEICFGPQADGETPWFDDEFCRQLVKERWEEVTRYSVGPMTLLHLRLAVDQTAKDRIFNACKQGAVLRRLRFAGVGLAGGLGLLAVAFGYLKIDQRTGGMRHGRLRLAAALAILGLAAAVVIAIMGMVG